MKRIQDGGLLLVEVDSSNVVENRLVLWGLLKHWKYGILEQQIEQTDNIP